MKLKKIIADEIHLYLHDCVMGDFPPTTITGYAEWLDFYNKIVKNEII